MLKNIFILALFFSIALLSNCRWSEKQAADWYAKIKWGAGVNFAPAYAVNEIQMWDSLDLEAIDRQLLWATSIGFTKFRVFLHIEPYIKNSTKFIKDIFSFLATAKTRGAGIIFVLFDDCWNDHWISGKQPDPIPGVHNSQWVQCPGKNAVAQEILKSYVIDIIGTFKDSSAVLMWDLYNEVGNSGYGSKSLPLIKKVFEWGRSVNPSQPLTSGWWNPSLIQINQYILNESDVITFHAYCDYQCTKDAIINMKIHKRPVICTEYMARPTGSKFITHLPLFKQENVWAISWGFVFGRIQTYYPWGSKEGAPVPQIWFHDVVHPDGTPFDKNQTDFIRSITSTTLQRE